MTQTNPETSTPLSTIIKNGKDIVSFLRDGALLVLAILLVALPTTFNSILVKAGFVEGSVAGFKWQSGLAESNEALVKARATITSLQTQNDELAKALGD